MEAALSWYGPGSPQEPIHLLYFCFAVFSGCLPASRLKDGCWIIFSFPAEGKAQRAKELFAKCFSVSYFYSHWPHVWEAGTVAPRNIAVMGLCFENSSQIFPFRAKEIQIFNLHACVSLFGTIKVDNKGFSLFGMKKGGDTYTRAHKQCYYLGGK